MSDLNELIKYIEVLEAEPFTGWTGGNKKGYLTACTSIKKKAEKLLHEQANGVPTDNSGLHLQRVSNNEVAVCMCEDDWNAEDIELTCKHCKKPIEFKQTDC